MVAPAAAVGDGLAAIADALVPVQPDAVKVVAESPTMRLVAGAMIVPARIAAHAPIPCAAKAAAIPVRVLTRAVSKIAASRNPEIMVREKPRQAAIAVEPSGLDKFALPAKAAGS